MVSSMTAYTLHSTESNLGTITWEIRSVNHKYCDVKIKLPEILRDQEFFYREELKKHVTRGKIDCFLTIRFKEEERDKIILNENLTNNLLKAIENLNQKIKGQTNVQIIDILKWPGVIISEELDLNNIKDQIKTSFLDAILDFVSIRKREGNSLNEIIKEKLEKIEKLIAKLNNNTNSVVLHRKEKLKNKLEELHLHYDNDRLEQELVHFANRIDIEEEIDRLHVHLDTTKKVLTSGKLIGRKLDFLMQEMNRESNTIASKSLDNLSASIAIELKVLVEQIREQVQNIE